MCGICGYLNFDGKPVNQEILKDMNQNMWLRGPDDSGTYLKDSFCMAMRRLSIIDLQGGKQPITNEDGSVHLVLNGEIYNYIELRKELELAGHRFYTNSDVEVLVHLYEDYGTDAIQHLNGMFAFALWDESRQRLWLGRDRFGIKPLVYFKTDNELVFASTLEALACHNNFEKQIDHESLLLYFMLGYVPSPRTIWKNGQKLPPGHWLMVENKKVLIKRYWSLKPQNNLIRKPEDFVKELREKFENSIELHSRSDVPVGTFLSGGVDSSAVTSLFSEISRQSINTFTMDFEGKDFNESDYAQLVAEQLKTKHHLHNLNLDYALNILEELLPLIDEPMADSAIIPSYILSKMASQQGIKVVLCGAGGDELFGGYSRHYPNVREKLNKLFSFLPLRFWSKIGKTIDYRIGHYGGLCWDKGATFGLGTSGINLGIFGELLNDPREYSKAMELTKNQFSNLEGLENDWGFSYGRMLTDTNNYLLDNVLELTDRTSMAASIEVRVPLLDHNLAELSFSVPEKINIGNSFKESKVGLKRAIKSNLPKKILNRKKAGFNSPVYDWIKKKHPKFEDRILNPRHSSIQNLFDISAIKNIWSNDSKRVAGCETFFMIHVAELWLEAHE